MDPDGEEDHSRLLHRRTRLVNFRNNYNVEALGILVVIRCLLEDTYTVEPLNNGHIGGRDFVPCREVVHYRRSTIFLLIISTFQWLNESMRVRGFQINRCLHDTLALSHGEYI